MRISKKTVIFLLLFSIILIGITIAAIIYTSINWTDQFSTVIIEDDEQAESAQTSENNNQAEPFSGETTELSSTYRTNALNIKENIHKEGNPVEGSDYEEKIKITYPEISNLADSTVRTNINEGIREKVLSYYSGDVLSDTNVKHLEINAKVTASFSDVLSVRIDIIKEYVNGDVARDFTGLNYRLENGEQIAFNNIFIDGASIKNILRHGVYNSLAWDYRTEDITDMKEVDYSNLDDIVYQTLNDYNTNENPEYCFSEREIAIKLNSRIITIPMEDCYEQIAIYDRYISQNQLYASTSMANDIPILVDRDEYSEMDVYMKINDNLIIDISLNVQGLDRNSTAINTAIENYKTALNNSINSLKSSSEEDDDTYVYFISRITAEVDSSQNKLIFVEDTYRYTAYSGTQFEVYVTSPILTEKRDIVNDYSKTYFDLNDTSIDIQRLSNSVEYNLTTGNLFGELEDNEEPNVEEPNNGDVENNTVGNETNTNIINTNETNNNVNENIVENNTSENNVSENTTTEETDEDEDDDSAVVTF